MLLLARAAIAFSLPMLLLVAGCAEIAESQPERAGGSTDKSSDDSQQGYGGPAAVLPTEPRKPAMHLQFYNCTGLRTELRVIPGTMFPLAAPPGLENQPRDAHLLIVDAMSCGRILADEKRSYKDVEVAIVRHTNVSAIDHPDWSGPFDGIDILTEIYVSNASLVPEIAAPPGVTRTGEVQVVQTSNGLGPLAMRISSRNSTIDLASFGYQTASQDNAAPFLRRMISDAGAPRWYDTLEIDGVSGTQLAGSVSAQGNTAVARVVDHIAPWEHIVTVIPIRDSHHTWTGGGEW